MTLGLGRVADRLDVALVEVLQAREDGAAGPLVEVTLDLDDRRRRIAHLPEEFHAHGADRRRHPVQDETRRRDDAVATFLLDSGDPREELVGDILAETGLAEGRTGNHECLATLQRPERTFGIRRVIGKVEGRHIGVVDFAEVVVPASDFQPAGIRRHHAPRCQVVERRAPQHSLLAAGVHRNIATDARRVGRCRIDGEDEFLALRRFHHATRHDARTRVDRGCRHGSPRQNDTVDRRQPFEFLGVDDRRTPIERHRAAGVTRAAASGNDRKFELDAPAHQAGNLGFGVRIEHEERVFNPPVGGVGDMRYARQAVEANVVTVRMARQDAHRAPAQLLRCTKRLRESVDGRIRAVDERRDLDIQFHVGTGAPALVDLHQAVAKRVHEEFAPLRVVQQIVLQIGIALDDPDIAQYFEEHPRRTPRAALAAQYLEQTPHVQAEQPNHDFAVGERRVVVRNLPQPHRRRPRNRRRG